MTEPEPQELRDALQLFNRCVPGFPPRWRYWMARVTVLDTNAVWLTLGFDPSNARHLLSEFQKFKGDSELWAAAIFEAREDEIQQAAGWIQSEYDDRLSVIRNWALNDAIMATVYSDYQDDVQRETIYDVRLSEIAARCVRFGWYIPEQLRALVPDAVRASAKGAEPQRDRWPWGEYETHLLRVMDDVARKWWVNYDPADPTTAKTKDEIVGAIMADHGCSKNQAEAIYTVLRPDDLRTGPRR